MHLTGKTYAPNIFSAKVGLPQCLTNRGAASPPPIFRMLLGPANLWRSKWLVFFRRGCEHRSTLVNNERPRAAGSDINAE
jgi:hypothetical protein